MPCTSHHHACECREQRFAILADAAREAAMELDWLKNELGAGMEDKQRIKNIIERVHLSCNGVAASARQFQPEPEAA